MLSTSFIEMRKRNAVRILQRVREEPGLSRADIARTCDLAKSTVSSVVDALVQDAILQETGSKESSRGRRPVGLNFNPAARVAVGISLDHNQTEIVLGNLDGVVQAVSTKRHRRKNNLQSISSFVLSELKRLLTEQKLEQSRIGGIGLAVPGPLSSLQAGNSLDYETLRELLSREFECPILVDSNTNMAALAESRLGVARDSEVALVVRLGHEVRSALIIDHKLLKGRQGRAGELGHLSVPGFDRACKCGRHGCINSVAATNSIVEKCQASGVQAEDIDEVVSAAISNDGRAREALIDAARAVGYGIASCINIFAPNSVIVTGRLVAARNIFLDPLHEAIALFSTTDNLNNCNFAFDDSQNHIEAIGASLAALLQEDFLQRLVSANGARLIAEA